MYVRLASIAAFVLTVVSFGPPAIAQAPSPAPPMFSAATLAACAKIRDAALDDDYSLRRVEDLADTIGPRLSGSPGAAAAVTYVQKQFQALGVTTRLQPIMVPHWVRGAELAQLTSWPGQPQGLTQKVVVTALGSSPATPQTGIEAPVVVVPDFATLERLGQAGVAGKIVLFEEKFDVQMAHDGLAGQAYGSAVAYRGRGPAAASKLGAVAALVRSVGSADFRIAHAGGTGFRDAKPIPAAAIAAEDADKITRLSQRGVVRLRLILTPQTMPDVPSNNVIAEIPGREHPEQVVTIGGHLDSWDLGDGAIDDGAGVAIAMETAQLLQHLQLRPRRTIRIVAFMNEENGTRGGQGYADAEKAKPQNDVAAIEADTGASHPLGVTAYITPASERALRPLMNVLAPIGAIAIRRADESPEEDIRPLSELGTPALGILQDDRHYFDYHHTAADTFDKIVPRELAESSAVMAVVAYGLAEADTTLARMK
ncbi:MAG TPA: M20/M25/M40 family metallo-hydrolase [Candidatus Baltobacteraceae bacterium]